MYSYISIYNQFFKQYGGGSRMDIRQYEISRLRQRMAHGQGRHIGQIRGTSRHGGIFTLCSTHPVSSPKGGLGKSARGKYKCILSHKLRTLFFLFLSSISSNPRFYSHKSCPISLDYWHKKLSVLFLRISCIILLKFIKFAPVVSELLYLFTIT